MDQSLYLIVILPNLREKSMTLCRPFSYSSLNPPSRTLLKDIGTESTCLEGRTYLMVTV